MNNTRWMKDDTTDVNKELMSMRKVFLRIIGISVIPILVMGIVMCILENNYFRNILKEEIKRELRTLAYGLSERYSLLDDGDYTMDENGIVYKGNSEVSGYLDSIGDDMQKIGLVCTFFYGDTRIDTTVVDQDGNSMAGTRLKEDIYKTLKETGEELFCEATELGGRTYYGYYIPHKNSDGEVAVIFFAGRLQSEVFANAGSYTYTIIGTGVIVLIIGILISLLCTIYIVGFTFRYFKKDQVQNLHRIAAGNQTDFMTLINREVRDPIDAITILSDKILEEETSHEVRESVLGIKQAGNSMMISFNSIQEYSMLEWGNTEICQDEYEIIKLVEGCVKKIEPGVERKHLDLQVDYDENMPDYLKGDQSKIRQILDNILENAVKYTYDGAITLSVRYRKITPDKIDVTFTVTDSGVGIRKEDAEKLFYSIGKVGENKNVSIKGTGLGLLICKRLVNLLDGRISVESEIGKGSTFTFTIPQDVVSSKTVKEKLHNDI